MATSPSKLPFDFTELEEARKNEPPPEEPQFATATDNVKLSIRVYKPRNCQPLASMVFLHGGGAHSGAGYNLLARRLAETYQVAVYTPDLRGHGHSEGPRGDAPSVKQVWKDVDTVIDFALSNNNNDTIPLFLGGHSSGGGLVLNYATVWEKCRHADKIHAYILISPQLGHLAKVDRPLDETRVPFAKVNVAAFIGNGILGWWGHSHAVQFQYPKELLEQDPLLVSSNTVNMANAITPVSPQTQFQKVDKPLALWIGQDDELFLPERVVAYVKEQPNMEGTVLAGISHLGVLTSIDKALGPWISARVQQK